MNAHNPQAVCYECEGSDDSPANPLLTLIEFDEKKRPFEDEDGPKFVHRACAEASASIKTCWWCNELREKKAYFTRDLSPGRLSEPRCPDHADE